MSRSLFSPLKSLSFGVVVFSSLMTFLWLYEKGDPRFVYVEIKDHSRIPAALRQAHPAPESGVLKILRESEFLPNLKIVNTPSASAIQFQQFAVKDGEQYTLTCLKFDEVELQFSADGQATAGKSPIMVVKAPCMISTEQIEFSKAIIVPTEQIKAQTPHDGDLKLKEVSQFQFNFQNTGAVWPAAWVLDRVIFKSSQSANKVFETSEILTRSSLDKIEIPTLVW